MALTERQKSYFISKGLGQLNTKEKELLDFYELMWHLRHHVPTIEEVATRLKLKQTEINYFLTRKPVVAGLEKRGIPWRQHSQADLTATQVATAVTMMNFADTRSNEDKLDQLGINPSQYYAWLNDPQFKNLVDNLSEQNLKNIKPTAIGELTKKINAGDWNAVKYYLDVTGAVQNNDAPQSEQLMRMIIEILQKHIKDPVILVAVAQDLKAATQNRTLDVVNPHAEIESTAVEFDPELENAKKKLGIS